MSNGSGQAAEREAKHHVILNRLSQLDGEIDRLSNLQNWVNPTPQPERGIEEKVSTQSLGSFLSTVSDRIAGMRDRLCGIIDSLDSELK